MICVATALKEAVTELLSITRDRSQAWLEAELLLGHILQKDRAWLLTHQETTLETRTYKRFLQLLKRRAQYEPLAYLFGEALFCGRPFIVNRSTLIPRLETEQLVDETQKHLISAPQKKILIWDVGTGSGVLAITLKALFPQATVIGTDISPSAIRVAKRNAHRLLRVSPLFFQADLLDGKVQRTIKKQEPSSLVIVANLPYLPKAQKRTLSRQVIAHEPLSALFAEKQGRALIEQLVRKLGELQIKTGIPLFGIFECDPSHIRTLQAYAQRYFRKINVVHDIHQRARFFTIES